MPTSAPTRELDAVVVGAGFAGLYMLHRLRGLGLDAVVLEAADGVGGTWYWNRYPGARCDSESYAYSYSFSEELQQEWRWTQRYPDQPEVLSYLEHVADRFDLRRDIVFGARVARAEFDDDAGRWDVVTSGGDAYRARFVVTAVGCLSAANVPDLPGLADFDGDWFHTGRWPHEGVDFGGRRVGVVGTGSTGIQAIPVIAADAEHLTVFQRTPNYSIPARNGPMSDEAAREVKRNYGEIRRLQRTGTNGHPFTISDRSALEVSPAERSRTYEAAWDRGGLRFRGSYSDLLSDLDANETASAFLREKIRSVVRDPETAQMLVPHDHPFATKRPPIDTHYFETYNQPHVDLVDVRADPIAAIEPAGVRLGSGRRVALDTLVFATGFDAMTGPLLSIDVRGAGGVALRDEWSAGPHTYLGLAMAGFPNLFTITGPGSPSVLTNMPTSIEQHVDWITRAIAHMRAEGLSRIEATTAAQEDWVAHVNEAAHRTLLPRASTSWYLGANVPGKPRVFMPYAGGLGHYTQVCDDVAARGYAGFELSA